ncbi:MAG: tricarboxylic transport TctC [Spirochaetae bacterium HGW-Spirochaetae-7]|jgi:putative tricarboxylic transport membrane protein|nr:MAG: tricarboxylic transport TctC [Spirochaetae bacterium HGW-Spirochaetae-7]
MNRITRTLAAVAMIAAIATPAFAQAKGYPSRTIECYAPSGAGGGWDLTIRTVAKTLTETGLVKVAMPVENKAGGGGAVFLTALQSMKKKDNVLTVYSPPLLLINLNGTTPFSYKDTTPLARLITDFGAFVVRKDSKYTSITQVMADIKVNPTSVKIGGNSSAGSMDHIQFLVVAQAAGVKGLKQVQYIAFQDNAGAAQLLGGHIDLLTTGLGDVRGLVESGDLRVLASTAPTRPDFGIGKDVPTCREQGIDADFLNWRGIFGPPQMPDYAVKFWRDALGKMVKTPEWQKACQTNGWVQNYADQPDFEKFLAAQNTASKNILEELGMAK